MATQCLSQTWHLIWTQACHILHTYSRSHKSACVCLSEQRQLLRGLQLYLKVPARFSPFSLLVKGSSVPAFRRTLYCIPLKRFRHSSSLSCTVREEWDRAGGHALHTKCSSLPQGKQHLLCWPTGLAEGQRVPPLQPDVGHSCSLLCSRSSPSCQAGSCQTDVANPYVKWVDKSLWCCTWRLVDSLFDAPLAGGTAHCVQVHILLCSAGLWKLAWCHRAAEEGSVTQYLPVLSLCRLCVCCSRSRVEEQDAIVPTFADVCWDKPGNLARGEAADLEHVMPHDPKFALLLLYRLCSHTLDQYDAGKQCQAADDGLSLRLRAKMHTCRAAIATNDSQAPSKARGGDHCPEGWAIKRQGSLGGRRIAECRYSAERTAVAQGRRDYDSRQPGDIPRRQGTSRVTACKQVLLVFRGNGHSEQGHVQGANQAAAAAKLSHKTVMIGQVCTIAWSASDTAKHGLSWPLAGQLGTDANANLLREALGSLGADLTHVRQVEGPTGSTVILLQPSGERATLVCRVLTNHACLSRWAVLMHATYAHWLMWTKLFEQPACTEHSQTKHSRLHIEAVMVEQARTASWWLEGQTRLTGSWAKQHKRLRLSCSPHQGVSVTSSCTAAAWSQLWTCACTEAELERLSSKVSTWSNWYYTWPLPVNRPSIQIRGSVCPH